MRNNHLLDIPDLPLEAFRHVGDRKIKLYGPVSSAVNAVTNVVSDVTNAVAGTNPLQSGSDGGGGGLFGDILGGFSNVVGGALNAVGNVASSALNTAETIINNTVSSAIQDPIGTVAKVATAIVAPELLPAVTAGDALAHGASPTQALTQAAVSYTASGIGQDVAAETGSNLAGSAASGAASSALTGKNPITGALSAAINNLGNSGLNSLVNSPSASGGLPSVSSLPTATGDQAPTTDYSSGLDTSLTSGQNLGGFGATTSTSPNLNSMNGAQGLTLPTLDGGTESALGYTAPNASANLGDPNSFINNPNVLGTAVAPTDTSNNIILPKVNFANAILPTTAPSNLVKQGVNATPGTTGSGGSFNYQDPTMSNAPSEFTASGEKALNPDQLKQLYSSLVPELASILINPSNKVIDTGLSNAKYAEGGLAEINKMLNPAFVKPTEPQVLRPQGHQPAAPMTQLRQMGQGPLSGMIHRAHGGDIHKYEDAAPEGHHPEFITGVTGYYAHGGGTGQSDDIPAMLRDGDYVIDADAVAALGDGSSKAGYQSLMHFKNQFPHHDHHEGEFVPAQIADGEVVLDAPLVTAIGGGDNKRGAKLLDKMREELRAHKRSAPDTKIPPKAKSPLEYLKMAMKG